MSVWKKMCCAIDFSDHSRLTLETTCDLARQLGAELVLIHVYEPPAQADLEPVVPPSDLYGEYVAGARRKLEEWRLDAERLAGRPVRAKLVEVHKWHPAIEIVTFARDERCDLVVVGRYGHTGGHHVGIGSVAARVIHESDRSVLCIHPA